MKYTEDERLEIGRKVYAGEMTVRAATEQYHVSHTSIENYVALYREKEGLPPRDYNCNPNRSKLIKVKTSSDYSEFETMTREELIGEIIKARIGEARAKKGYMVKGDGARKEFVPITNKNTKS